MTNEEQGKRITDLEEVVKALQEALRTVGQALERHQHILESLMPKQTEPVSMKPVTVN